MGNRDKALVVGGSKGIGLTVAIKLLNEGYSHIYIVDKNPIATDSIPSGFVDEFDAKTSFSRLDLTEDSYSVFDEIRDIDTLFISAGFGRVALFEGLTEIEVEKLIKCDLLAPIKIIQKYYDKLLSDDDFYCGVMVSIAGHIASPYFSVYGSAKSGLAMFIQNLNVELCAKGCKNRILDVSPGALKGTSFAKGETDIKTVEPVAMDVLDRLFKREMLFIPDYDTIYKGVIDRYKANPMEAGLQSYEYKQKGGRVDSKPQVTIGYLSGTFDLFHIGHLNLLRRAKRECDYLIVSVHESGAWKGKETFISYEERKSIVANIKYVDKVVEDYIEDIDAWEIYHYNKLFVGSDYKNTDRFNRYEKFFEDKDAEIVYFPYTQGTSSTKLREVISDAIR